jgi:tRNA nucleotidyltransferase (CCA-adding enzyme)
VGGWLRDQILGVYSKDVDCEVHGLEAPLLERLLEDRGRVDFVGKAFGVYKWSVGSEVIDVALPREDSRGQLVCVRTDLGLEKAVVRRDFTCNALIYDPLDEEWMDLVGGRADTEARLLRAVDSERFGDDSLRVMRAARFVGTHSMRLDPELVALCRTLDLGHHPVERLFGELRRILLSQSPGNALMALETLGAAAEVLPDLDCVQTAEALQRGGLLSDRLEVGRGRLCVQLAILCRGFFPGGARRFLSRYQIERPGGIPAKRIALGLATIQHLPDAPSESELCHWVEHCELAWVLAYVGAWNPKINVESCMARGIRLGLDKGPLPVLLSGNQLLDLAVAFSGSAGPTRWAPQDPRGRKGVGLG